MRRSSDVSLADPLHIDALSIYFYADAALVVVTLTPARKLLDAHAGCRASPPDVLPTWASARLSRGEGGEEIRWRACRMERRPIG